MDRYLSRTLKNWAARYCSPENGREQLLETAAHPPVLQEAPARGLGHVREFAYLQPAIHPLVTWGGGSFTLSMAWPVQMASLVQAAV
jgi:hypothetical protein